MPSSLLIYCAWPLCGPMDTMALWALDILHSTSLTEIGLMRDVIEGLYKWRIVENELAACLLRSITCIGWWAIFVCGEFGLSLRHL